MSNKGVDGRGRRQMGALEAEVLTALWASDEPMTPAEVREALDAELAYTTVMTILSRLWKKSLVVRESRGRAYAYRPSVSEAELASQRMQAALKHVADRSEALSHFVGALPPSDERALRRILADGNRRR